jgi:putative nucleotidyltransferase with HDIG domain
VYQIFEWWDGSGVPQGLAGTEISLPARLAELAHQVVIFDRMGGPDAAIEMARRRAGSWFDPEVCAAFADVGAELLSEIATADVWQMVLEVEPDPRVRIPEWRLDAEACAFADMIDLKTPFTLGHSSEVGDLAAAAAEELGLEPGEVDAVRRAGMLHDIGRAAVSNAVWEKASTLHSADWEKVRLHPYFTERVLSRSLALQPLARVAGMHHERQDGGGYHHAAIGREIPVGARLIAAADVFQAMTHDRPHRPALPPEEAAEQLVADAAAERLDGECTAAVLAAAGHRRPVATPWPDELTDREVEVLRLAARGLSNKEIAEHLYLSRRTAEHHVQHIYTKIGVSSRASLALYAMEHDLFQMQ